MINNIKINNESLQKIKSNSLTIYKDINNRAIDSEYHIILSVIIAFLNYAGSQNIKINVDIAEPKYYDVIED